MKFKFKIIFYFLQIYFLNRFKSRRELEKFQKRKIDKFAKKALSKSTYYNKFFQGKIYNWGLVPQISKDEFMDNFEDINIAHIAKENAMQVALNAEITRNFKSEIKGFTVGLSTGTSGKRGLFLISENERAKWVALIMNRVLRPQPFKKQKVAFFLRANSNLYTSVQSAFFQFKYFDIFRPISELLGELNEYKPGIVAAQPSILVEICRALIDKRISILPNQIISFAEVLHENDKILFENSFKIKISEVYQCMEGFLGATCALGVMHLNEDFIMFEKEWLDQDHFYPIITDFSRYSQPLVKYKLTDILKIKNTPCKCGSQNLAIEKIIGRNDDILIFNNIKIYPDLIARRIAQITNAFQRYTIVQVSEKKLEIAIESEEIYFESLKKEFRFALNSILEPYCINNIDYFFTNKIEFVPSNKTRKIKRLICENNI